MENKEKNSPLKTFGASKTENFQKYPIIQFHMMISVLATQLVLDKFISLRAPSTFLQGFCTENDIFCEQA